MTSTDSAVRSGFDNVFVLVGDAQRARVVRPSKGEGLDVVWEGYAGTPDVRALEQAPDITRNSKDATPRVRGESNAEFARDVSTHVRSLTDGQPGSRLLVIAPASFASALESELGSAWPSRAGDVVRRDETRLDDTSLRKVIETTLTAHA